MKSTPSWLLQSVTLSLIKHPFRLATKFKQPLVNPVFKKTQKGRKGLSVGVFPFLAIAVVDEEIHMIPDCSVV
jgi:hypothetical protein